MKRLVKAFLRFFGFGKRKKVVPQWPYIGYTSAELGKILVAKNKKLKRAK